ncbi:glycerophosphodiester phosphodiesterase, partial [Pseudomonas aeruginosa]
PPAGGTWMGIELRRELTVTERFTLGESSYKVPAAQLWTRKAMDCVRREPVKVVMFGIETAEDYRTARALGADAVMSNSPRKMEAIRRRVLADQPGG